MRKLITKSVRTRFGTPRLIFQVTTKGNIPIVQDTVNRIQSVCREIEYSKYEVWVVDDAEEEYENCRNIKVPANYSCNAVFKGRALQFAVDLRSKEKRNTEDTYVYHLDDESLITKQTICSVLTFLEDDPTPISEGLIIYPVYEKEKLTIANLLDTLRPFCCFECVDFMTKGNPAYMHGSNLLVRSGIEEMIGWNNGKTIAEDTLFAVKAKQNFGSKIFGWHGGVIEEKSPSSLHDVVRQRKRWFYGLVQNLKYLSPKDRILQSTRALIWTSGFFSGLISVFALLIPQSIPGLLRIVFSVTSILWLLSYQIGAYLNGKYLSISSRLKYHIITLISSPFIGILECAMPIIAVVRRPKTFEVIKK